MTLAISSAALQRILDDAARSPDAEICGLLLGAGLRVDAARACANVAADPRTAFEIDPAALIAAHRAARAGGAALIGHYHSHPGGAPVPSPRDAAAAVGDGAVWLIVAGPLYAAWQSTRAGQFEPIDVMPFAEGCAMEAVSPEERHIPFLTPDCEP